LVGWAAGIAAGTWMAVSLGLKSSIFTVHLGGFAIPGYAALWSLAVNVVAAVVVSVLVRAIGMATAEDRTRPEDYLDAI
ncbi:MAG: solute:Na+ symporter, family, partial [Paraburkholderia sp.]|nr:solute:Na+ symporter, family [Paraburkholderia sp.]